MKNKLLRLGAYSFSHLCVDLCCALLVLPAARSSGRSALVFLLYNYCAFALQMPIGLWADRLNRNAVLAAAGCLLVALAAPLHAFPILTAIVAGLGNACFHVGGGVDVLNDSGDKAAFLGVFVSPGALGLYLGGLLSRTKLPLPLIAALVMLLCAGLTAWTAAHTGVLRKSENAPFSLRGTGSFDVILSALCLFLVVVLRSFVGMTGNFAWKSGGFALLATLMLVLGKTLGGFAMDRIGGRLTSLLTLLPAAVLYFLADNPFAGLGAILLFNMTMPVTLSALARKMPGSKGFSFGLLTCALFLGVIPTILGLAGSSPSWLLSALCVLSVLLMLPGLGGRDENGR